MRIGELAERSGVTAKTVRYYESIGLLPEPDRTESGYRAYDGDALDRLRFVRDAQSTGLTLTEIKSVIELKEAGATTCSHTRSLIEDHIAQLDAQLAQLQEARQELVALAERAAALDPSDCVDPNRCQVIEGNRAST